MHSCTPNEPRVTSHHPKRLLPLDELGCVRDAHPQKGTHRRTARSIDGRAATFTQLGAALAFGYR